MTDFWWVRHGPTNRHDLLGWTDAPADLSDTARIDRLSDYLPADATVISSDLCRAVATADALQRHRPRLPHDPALREIHFGTWELRRFDEIEAEDPERLSAFWREPGAVRPPEGETWHEMRARSDAVVDRLITAHSGGAVVIVAHFGVILGQVERALDIPTSDAFAQRIDNLSVTELTLAPTGWQVGAVNHLP